MCKHCISSVSTKRYILLSAQHPRVGCVAPLLGYTERAEEAVYLPRYCLWQDTVALRLTSELDARFGGYANWTHSAMLVRAKFA